METISPDQNNIRILTKLYYEISEFLKAFTPVFK